MASSKPEQAPVSSSVSTLNKTQRSLTKAAKRTRDTALLHQEARGKEAGEGWGFLDKRRPFHCGGRGAARRGGATGPAKKWLCGCRSGRAVLSSQPADKPVSGERSLVAGVGMGVVVCG